MRKRTKSLRGEEGQALVELALVVPLLLFIIFAIIDFGLAINQYNNTTNLANLGARATAVLSSSNLTPGSCTYTNAGTPTTYTTLAGYVDCEGALEGGLSQVTVTVCDPSGSATITTGDSVSVHINSTFNWLGLLHGGVGNVGGVIPSLQSTIGASATMRMEGANTTTTGWLGTPSNYAPGTSNAIPGPTFQPSGSSGC